MVPLRLISKRLAGLTPTQANVTGYRHATSLRDSTCDVAIVGGGVIGSSIALHLACAMPKLRVMVFEGDTTYSRSSAPRSAGGIRQQFSLRANVELSIYGAEFLKNGLQQMCAGVDVDTDVQFKENGYLILASADGETALRENVAVQHAAGADWIRLLDSAALNARFPWLSTDGVVLGAFGEKNEGYFDPWALMQAMRKGAIARGVVYVPEDVVSLRRSTDGTISCVGLSGGDSVSVGSVVNAAGAYSGHVVKMCGLDVLSLPVHPRKRSMWQFRVQDSTGNLPPVPPENTPLTIDSSGSYFRSEGSCRGTFVCGRSPNTEDDHDFACDDMKALQEQLDHSDEDLFTNEIWPALAERAPALEALKVESSWAGFYEYNSLDQNGVVDWHPDVANMLIASGFSGHGLQQAPGVGRACAELIEHGQFKTTDLSCFDYGRIVRNEPIFERGIY